jgi:hypothetical protein
MLGHKIQQVFFYIRSVNYLKAASRKRIFKEFAVALAASGS